MENKPEFYDREIQCVECGEWWVFTASNQEFFWSKELSEPKRCKACRDKRRRHLVPDRAVSDAR